MWARFAVSSAVLGLLLCFNVQASVETWKPEFFCSLVQTDYEHRPLRGWESTAVIIQKTLQSWYPDIKNGLAMANVSSDEIRAYFQEIGKCRVPQIIYIAVRQSPDGEWENLQKKFDLPRTFFKQVDFGEQLRIVLLDACHAAAVVDAEGFWKDFSSLTFFASQKDQVTYELMLNSRQPVDIRESFPKVYEWIQQNIPLKNPRISFFGLIWLQAWLDTPRAPETKKDWIQFGEKCRQLSIQFSEINHRLASEIRVK